MIALPGRRTKLLRDQNRPVFRAIGTQGTFSAV